MSEFSSLMLTFVLSDYPSSRRVTRHSEMVSPNILRAIKRTDFRSGWSHRRSFHLVHQDSASFQGYGVACRISRLQKDWGGKRTFGIALETAPLIHYRSRYDRSTRPHL